MRYAVYISGSGTRISKALNKNPYFSEKIEVVVLDSEGV